MEQGVRDDSIPGEVAALQKRVAELEALLTERDRAFGTVISNLPGFVYRCRNDRDWTMEYLSEACLAVTGYRPEELAENALRSYNDLILPEHREYVWSAVQDPLSRRVPYELEYAIRHASGEVRWMWERGRGVYDAGGRLLCLEGYIEDATQRRRAEDARRESEARVLSIGNNLPRGMLYQIIRSPDGSRRLSYLSEGVRGLYGCSPEEGMADPARIYGMVAEEDRQRLREEEEAAYRTLSSFSVQVRMTEPSGKVRWSHFASSPRLLEDGSTCWDGVELDITERKITEEKLRESESLLRSIGDNLPMGMLYRILVSAGGIPRYTYVSEGVRQLHGCSPEEVLADAERIYGQVAEEDLERLSEEEEQATRTLSTFSTHVRMKDPSGRIRWSHFVSSPRRLDDGSTCWDGVELDITERKLAEERLRESEARLRSVSNNLPDAFLTQAFRASESDGWELSYVSDGIRKLFGLTPEEALADPARIYDRILPEDRKAFWDGAEEAYRALAPMSVQVRVDTASRGIRWLHFASKPRTLDDGTTCWDGIGSDITDRKRAEEALRHALEERETLLRELYHRTKNNMQVILALMERQTLSNPEPAVRIALGEMKGRIAAMALVHEMLYQSQNLSRVNLGEYLGTLAGLLREGLAPGSGRVRLSLETDEVQVPLETAIPCGLIANELVTNSLKYAFPDRRSGEIRIGLRREGAEAALLEIADDGAGLPAGLDIARVKTMGLWTVNLLVRQLGGEVSFSGEGGATFRIRFPLEVNGGGGEA